MADVDLFEARFASAYRRYLDEAPTEVDAAAVARAIATGAQQARSSRWPWSLRLSPALPWLVLLALLMTAFGAALFVGSHRPALAFACPAGTDPDARGRVDQARPPITFAGPPMAFDRRAGLVVALVPDSWALNAQTWTFDVCTNTWARMSPRVDDDSPNIFKQLPAVTGGVVYDVDADRTISVDGSGWAWAYDLGANVWTVKAHAPVVFAGAPRLVYDSASGLVVVRALVSEFEAQLWTYDVDTDTWARLREENGPETAGVPTDALLAYDASVDRLVAYGRLDQGAGTWLFDLRTGRWSRSGTETLKVQFGPGVTGGEIAYDEEIGRSVIFSRGRVIAYDAAADRWDVLAEGWDPDQPGDFAGGPTDRSYTSMVYDAANGRLVVNGGSYRTVEMGNEGLPVWVRSDDVLAFDPATREWATLLDARTVAPPS